MPTPIHSPSAMSSAFADAVTALRRLGRLARLRYEDIEQEDSPEARAAHVSLLRAEVALLWLRAANQDEGAATVLRTLMGGRA